MTDQAPDTLPFVLYRRIVGAATYALERSPQYKDRNSEFYLANLSDGWRPELTDDTTITYTRTHHEGAKIIAKNLQLTSKSKIEYGDPVIIPSDPQRFIHRARVPEGQPYKVSFKESSTEVKSLSEEAEVGLKITIEAHFGYKSGTATGGPEGGGSITGEASAKYARKWGVVNTIQKEVNIEIPIHGPFYGYVELVRDVSDVSTTIECTPDFEFQVEVQENGRRLYGWNSYAELLSVLQGEAPSNRDLAKAFQYDVINKVSQKLGEAPFRSLTNRKIPMIHWTAQYNNVSNFSINYVEDQQRKKDVE